jgi:hypothetical protein
MKDKFIVKTVLLSRYFDAKVFFIDQRHVQWEITPGGLFGNKLYLCTRFSEANH